MADSMQFDLVSPERLLVSGQAKSVQIPGAEGQMTAMPDHAPTITTLRPGVLRVEMTDGTKDFAVTGGFAEITSSGVSVLAEQAYPVGAANRAEVEAHLAEARARAAEAPAELKDAAELVVADMTQLLNDMV
jgi:F-type H+-transporting ATPase subunit epsilon